MVQIIWCGDKTCIILYLDFFFYFVTPQAPKDDENRGFQKIEAALFGFWRNSFDICAILSKTEKLALRTF